jgi:hypothetical protein
MSSCAAWPETLINQRPNDQYRQDPMDDLQDWNLGNDGWSVLNELSFWGWVLSTNETEACGVSMRRFYSKRTGRFATSPFRCRAIICMECAPGIVQAYLQHFARLWQLEPAIWFAELDSYRPELLDRISKRRSRVRGEYALFVPTYGPYHHRVFIFSNSDLSGRKQPSGGRWLDVPTAFNQLRTALCLPDLSERPRSISMGWRPKQQTKPPADSAYIGQVRNEVWYLALDLVDHRVDFKYGIRPFNHQKPSAVTDDDWIVLVKDAVSDARAQLDLQEEEIVSDEPM